MAKSSLPPVEQIKAAIVPEITGILWRVVESQEQIATLALVDSLEEQASLERLLEQSKPPFPENCHDLDYLLATPFRYPPLKWGSRFGCQFEPGIFYGSEAVPTALAETAYYRIIFWTGMETPPPSEKLRTQHTIYSVNYKCAAGLHLNAAPFENCQDLLRHPQHYETTQTLGSIMRDLGVDGFKFISARCPDNGFNIALFTPGALASKRPKEKQNWICETTGQSILFSGQGTLYHFSVSEFQIEGEVPQPPD